MIKQFIPDNFCLQCQGCCRFNKSDSSWSVHLLNEEIGELLDAKKIQPIAHLDYYLCPFLNLQDNRCKIYKLRPFECQLYPFLIRNYEKNFFLSVDLKCPFVKDNLDNNEFREYSEYLISWLNTPYVSSMLKENPQIIHQYEEAINLGEINSNAKT